MKRLNTASAGTQDRQRAASTTLLIALCLSAFLSGCEQRPPWPPPDHEYGWTDIVTPEMTPSEWRYGFDVMDADSTLHSNNSPGLVMTIHSMSLIEGLNLYHTDDDTVPVPDTTITWPKVEAAFTGALAGTGLTRDSTFNRVMETPIVGHENYFHDPRATRQPYVRSHRAVWTYENRWTNDYLTFAVIFDVVYSGYPDRSYRFLTVIEPRREWR